MEEIIDKKVIELLKSELSDEIFEQLVDIYLVDLEKNVKLLDEYILRYKMKEARDVAHAIKGSSSNVGAVYLQKYAHGIESACKEENAEKMLSLFEGLKKAALETMAQMKDYRS